MAGVFTVRPKYGTNVVCSMGDTTGVAYVVVDVDFAERQREQMVYGEEEGGGRVLSAQHNTAEAGFTIAVLGSSESDVAAKVRTLNQAFGWLHGGTIQFKPIEYPNSVLHTYYHYLKSGPSVRLAGKAADLSGGFAYGEIHEFRVRIKAWATSDPDALTGISDVFVHLNAFDSNLNVVTVSAASMKGDVTFPFFVIAGNSVPGKQGFLMYVKRGGLESNGLHTGVHEFSNVTLVTGAGTNYVDANYYQTTAATGLVTFAINPAISPGDGEIDSIPVQATPLLRTLVPTGSTFKFRAISKFSEYTAYEANHFETGPWVTVVGDSVIRVTVMPEMAFPPVIKPDVMGNQGSTLLDNRYLEDLGYELQFERTVGAGAANIDMLAMAPGAPWIGEFTRGTTGRDMGGADELFFDSFTDNHGFYFIQSSPSNHYILRDMWDKHGSSLRELIFDSGQTHYVSTLVFEDTDREHDNTTDMDVHIDGLWGTIRPFEVS